MTRQKTGWAIASTEVYQLDTTASFRSCQSKESADRHCRAAECRSLLRGYASGGSGARVSRKSRLARRFSRADARRLCGRVGNGGWRVCSVAPSYHRACCASCRASVHARFRAGARISGHEKRLVPPDRFAVCRRFPGRPDRFRRSHVANPRRWWSVTRRS